jgi:DNA modification methylase
MIVQGNAVDFLKTLTDGSVQCCVTSPPYWGLRDYGTATWDGGDMACNHQSKRGKQGPSGQRTGRTFTAIHIYKDKCRKCGASRIDQQLGLELTPEAYVASMIAVFREVRRVLADDGTLWLNLGDTYAAQRGGTHQPAETLAGGVGGRTNNGEMTNRDRHAGYNPSRDASAIGLKHKDMVGIPWRIAFALQADGWYLRSDIIWAKPNPMTESVRDRPTKSHEYVFLLAKSANYYYDSDAIREPDSGQDHRRKITTGQPSLTPPGQKTNRGIRKVEGRNGSGRNIRTVWWLSPKPFKGAHFAVMPPRLATICILAGSRPGDVVLDPFVGSGTTLAVAKEHGRTGIGCELNPSYIKIAKRRIGAVTPSLCANSK